jgi:hypothetical protein
VSDLVRLLVSRSVYGAAGVSLVLTYERSVHGHDPRNVLDLLRQLGLR